MEKQIQVQVPVPESLWLRFRAMLAEREEPVREAVPRLISEAVDRDDELEARSSRFMSEG